MKKLQFLLLFVFIICFSSCKKEQGSNGPENVTVKGFAGSEKDIYGVHYWRIGIIFDHTVEATGTATITWYFANGTSTLTRTINFVIPIGVNTQSGGYTELTNIPSSYFSADSVKLSNFHLATGNYNITINNK